MFDGCGSGGTEGGSIDIDVNANAGDAMNIAMRLMRYFMRYWCPVP